MELTATDKNGVTQLENVVNGLRPAGATRSDYGMKHAKDIINASKAADPDDQRGRVVIMFTDGNPTDWRYYNNTVANGAISAAKEIKNAGAKIYTIGVFGEDPGDPINKYMNRVSSNCPNAFDMSEGGAGADADENAGYYSTAASADDLSKIFISISGEISEATNKALDGKTEVNDVVSDYFDPATNDVNSIKVYTADRTADGGWADKQLVTDPSVTVALSGKTIKVSGYNYAANYVTDNPKSDSTYGQKLIIEITVKPNSTGCNSAEIPTNADTAETHAAKVEVKSEDGSGTTFVTSHETAKVTGHKVIYDLDGGTGDMTGNGLYYPQAADVPVTDSVPTRDGHEFIGWKSDIDGDNKVYTSNGTNNSFTMPAANVTLTAQWKEIEAPDLSVTKTVTKVGETTVTAGEDIPTAYPGDEIEWTITVTNSGNAAGNFTLKDVLKDRTDELTVSPAMAEGANSYTIAPKNPTTGEPTTMTFTVTYTVQPADVTDNGLVNTVTMNNTSEDSVPVPTAQKYTVTGTIDNGGTVTNPSQTVPNGEASKEMTFTPADGYKITSVTVNSTAVSDLTLNSDGSYTYPALDSVTQNIAVIVETDKRTDLSYTVKYVDKNTNLEIQKPVVKDGKTFGDTVTGESEKVSIANYTYVEAKPDPLTISTDATKNVITLYYTKDAPTPGTFDFNDVIPDDGKVTPAITKTVKGNVGKNFKEIFAVTVKGADEKSNATMSNATMSNASYTGKAKVTYSDLKDIAFQFAENDKLTFRNDGNYTYTVREIPGGTSRMSYDTTEYTLTINVVLDEDSNTYQVESWQFTPGNREYPAALNIVNTYRTYHPSTPSKPTVEIPDDDALGLNTTDHFAYIVGYGNGEVRPQNNITRAEVATIFFRLLTDDVRDENLTKTNRYSDVTRADWYNTAVSTLSSMGIITGYPDGTFRPNAAITRAEFAAIAARFDSNGDKTTAKFSDIATHWAKDEISIAYNNGWITGYPNGTFGPQRDITRAETMTLVNRVLNRQPETEDDLLPNMTVWTDNANPNAWYYLAVQEATNSHYYKFKTNSKYEKWTELRETRDWTLLEK